MRWLVRLITPPRGLVLDPFAGSGTTLLAALDEGMRAIGIEQHEPYARITTARLSGRQPSLFDTA
ncbi:DNA methyltransferase [Streptomyces sp. NPDC048331]|uniref:DNA methyltransferase n=1 Tax=Streptomyces sp. NPDC048331 TaxID=3365534 RepID=UPI0037164D03